ncbi:transposase, partial [Leptotrichia sp. oral taxon 879]|uniref:transposase n=1 Tax=Leptotrichia sp. oral taxon 879 TaxID=1227267 RepID=UPI0012DC7E59
MNLFPNPTDVRTLVPFLSVLESKNLKFENIVADAGYESEENYEYLFNNNYTPYIKPQNYEKQKTRKFKQDISRAENMSFNEETDTYTCANNKKLEFKYISKRKNKSGHISEKKVYECNKCEGCPFAEKCKKTS